MRRHTAIVLILTVSAVLTLVACSGGRDQQQEVTSVLSGTVFVTGTDAPIPSVLAFQITINSLTLSDANGSVSVLSTPTPVEFSRLLGLRTLLALNSVPEGHYTSATISLQDPVISYLDLGTTPASVSVVPNASLTQSAITVNLSPALNVNHGGLAGLHLDFRLRESLELDGNGQITGVVTPVIRVRAIRPEDSEGFIDELRGGLVSVNVAGSSFVMQRPGGRQITVVVNAQTEFEGTDSLASLATPSVIEVSGRVQADGSLLARNVEVLTTERAFAAGLVLNTEPAVGPANSVTLLVREELPDLEGIAVGRPSNLAINDSTVFRIHHLDLPVADLLFNRSSLVLGQRVAVGGLIDSTQNPPALDTRRAILHRQGLEGMAVEGSVQVEEGNRGSFLLANHGFFGYLFAGPLRIRSTERTDYVNLAGLSAIEPSMRLRVVGLVLRDGNGNPLLLAGRIERVEPAGP